MDINDMITEKIERMQYYLDEVKGIIEESTYESLYKEVYNGYYDDYFSEMSMVACDEGLNVNVNQERMHLSIPYFKVYNHENATKANKVARLHFKDSGMEYHKDPLGNKLWKLNSKDIKKIIELLNEPSEDHEGYTNWQVLCYEWNRQNLLVSNFNDYFAGKYDKKYKGDSRFETAYVPSTQEMPDTWIYDPSKGKK